MELLRVENGNLYIVQGECQELRKKSSTSSGWPRESRVKGATVGRRGAVASPSSGGDHRFPSEIEPRTAAAEVLEECEGEMDSELEELFRRNQTNLTHIKQEIATSVPEQSTSLIDEAPTPC